MKMRTELRGDLGLAGLAVTLAALGVGCGGGGGTAQTMDTFCASKATAECTNTIKSCLSDIMPCTDARKALCLDWATMITSTDTARVFTPGNISACISKTTSVYNQTTIKPADLAAVDDTCEYVFQGAVASLMSCMTKYDCANKNDICDKNTCATKVTKGKDALCGNPGEVCSTGQYCAVVPATATQPSVTKCLDKIGSGNSCASAPCLETLRCSAGTCMALVAGGDACTSDSDCETANPYCDPSGGNVCGPGLKFATHSASCAAFGDTKAPAGGTGGSTGTGGSGGSSGSGGSDGGSSDGATGAGGTDGAAD